MTKPYDQGFWDELWATTLLEHADVVATRPPNGYLTTEVADLRPGRALDAGCGHGAETLWLAAHGWRVTAVDFSPVALAHASATLEVLGAEMADRVEWVEGDLATWAPPPGHFDLVVSLYVHVAASMEAMVGRLARGVTPGGTLLLVGHQPIDPRTGAATAAAGQRQVSVDAALAVLDSGDWEVLIAEDRPRVAEGSGVDAVIRARRLGP